jgi:DNA sulfur modification protein DndB
MPTLVPAIRARMGTRTYYVGAMRAREVAQQVGVASELENWEQLTIEELYQRELNRRRVEQEIAPYLVNTADRFFGSIIVLVKDPSSIAFETMGDLGVSLPAGVRMAMQDLGILTVGLGSRATGSGALVALDGQHRLAALRDVVQGKAVLGEYGGQVGDDAVTVIFVEHTSDVESRRLFTTLNRSARKVSKNDILLMGEDDARNIIGRELAQHVLFAPRGLGNEPLVKFDGNTIRDRDTAVTTLGALNDLVEVVAETLRLPCALHDEWSVRPGEDELQTLKAESISWVEALFRTFPELLALRDQPADVVKERAPDRPISMLLKPAGLVVFFKSVQVAVDPSRGALDDVQQAMNALRYVGWSMSAAHWQGLMLGTRGTISGRRNEWDLTAEVVACMAAGDRANGEFVTKVQARYGHHIGKPGSSLPGRD